MMTRVSLDASLADLDSRYVGQGEWGPVIQFPLVPAAAAVVNNKVLISAAAACVCGRCKPE